MNTQCPQSSPGIQEWVCSMWKHEHKNLTIISMRHIWYMPGIQDWFLGMYEYEHTNLAIIYMQAHRFIIRYVWKWTLKKTKDLDEAHRIEQLVCVKMNTKTYQSYLVTPDWTFGMREMNTKTSQSFSIQAHWIDHLVCVKMNKKNLPIIYMRHIGLNIWYVWKWTVEPTNHI